MNWIVIIAIWVLWMVFSFIRAAGKKRAAPPGTQSNQNSTPENQQVFHNNDLLKRLKERAERAKRRLETGGQTESREAENNPFLDREVASSRASHYSEERLAKEFERTHSQGKPLEHHLHNLGAGLMEEDTRKHLAEKPHPIRKLMKNPETLRNAIIINEILQKKHF